MGATVAASEHLETPARRDALDLHAVYERYFHEVERWLRAKGVPAADLEDLCQDVFLVVGRKLAGFDGGNLPGWLFRITTRTASDYRRRAWFKNLFSRRSEVEIDQIPWAGTGPVETVERGEAQRLLARALAGMSEKRRTAFVLFELEGYTGAEIAALLQVPVATVRTRLYHARRDFLARLRALAKEGT